MGYRTYVGEIDEQRLAKALEDENPYAVFENNTEICYTDIGFFSLAKEFGFYDEKQVDWGSFFWRCKGIDLLRMIEKKKHNIIPAKEIDSEKEYGIVHVELIMNAY